MELYDETGLAAFRLPRLLERASNAWSGLSGSALALRVSRVGGAGSFRDVPLSLPVEEGGDLMLPRGMCLRTAAWVATIRPATPRLLALSANGVITSLELRGCERDLRRAPCSSSIVGGSNFCVRGCERERAPRGESEDSRARSCFSCAFLRCFCLASFLALLFFRLRRAALAPFFPLSHSSPRIRSICSLLV